MENISWQEVKYAETFEGELRGLERRREKMGLTKSVAQGELDSLYKLDGDNWLGRGEAQDVAMAATIAAYESFISS